MMDRYDSIYSSFFQRVIHMNQLLRLVKSVQDAAYNGINTNCQYRVYQ